MYIKKISIILVYVIFLSFFEINAYSEEYDYGTSALYEAVPNEAKKYIQESNITPDGGGIAEITLESVLKSIITEIENSIKEPLSMFTSLLAVIILTSILKNMIKKDNSSVEQVFSVASSLTSTVIVSAYIGNSLSRISAAISSASDFSLTYIPVIAGVIAVGGHTSTAAVYTSVMMIGMQVITQITVNILFPVTSCLMGISATAGINKDLKIDKLGDGLKKAIVWTLGLIMTVFIGFLSLQSTITASTDSLSLRAARFAVSTSVPFVGGAVSDALSTVKTSVELLKTGIGSFGVITGCCVLFPVLIDALCYKFILFLSSVLSELLDSEDAGRMIHCGENVISIVISIIICFFLFLTISTALMLLICRQ